MAVIVGVHGIAQQLKGRHVLEQEWDAPLCDGVGMAGSQLALGNLGCAFYGALFRAPGTVRSGDTAFQASDLTDDEIDLLVALWHEGARIEPKRVVIASAFGRDPAHDGAFARAFLSIVSDERWTGSTSPWVATDQLITGG